MQCLDQVARGAIGICGQAVRRVVTKSSKPVVDGDYNDLFFSGNALAVVPGGRATTGQKAAAVNEKEYRQVLCIFRCPYVDDKSIFGLSVCINGIAHHQRQSRAQLWKHGAGCGGIAYARPGRRRLDVGEARLSIFSLAIGQAKKAEYPVA